MTAVKLAKKGRTFKERFIDELTRQCNGEDVAVLNKTLRDQLGWTDENFDKVRKQLIKDGTVKAAPGQGGKTRFVTFHPAKLEKQALSVFVSYSHADEAIKDQLLSHLKPLERLGIVKNWHDRMIKPGVNFADVISGELEKADIILLLVSIDFINSKYCYDIEMARAIERHTDSSARVIPIILRSCLWNHAPFGGIQAIPKDARSVTLWPDRDEALTTIAKSIHEVALELREQPA